MKIINKDAAYVQKNDVESLSVVDLPIPLSIYKKLLEFSPTFINKNNRYDLAPKLVNDGNRYDFVKLDDESEVEYFKGIDWIVDYNDYKDLSEEEIKAAIHSVDEEHDAIYDAYYDMTEEERDKHHDMFKRINTLELKRFAIGEILWFIQGHIKFELPEGVDYPKYYVQPGYVKKFPNLPNNNSDN